MVAGLAEPTVDFARASIDRIKLLQVPYRLLYPGILVFCCIGTYSLQNNVFDIYLAVLSKGVPSPLARESDEEKAEEPAAAKPEEKKDEKKEEKAPEKVTVKVDLDGLTQRIVAFPLEAAGCQNEFGCP